MCIWSILLMGKKSKKLWSLKTEKKKNWNNVGDGRVKMACGLVYVLFFFCKKERKTDDERKKKKLKLLFVVLIGKVFWRSFVHCARVIFIDEWISLIGFFCDEDYLILQGRKDDQRVCGTNNITYHSLCHVRKDSCNTGFNIDVKHEGPCGSWYMLIMLLDHGSLHVGKGLNYD